MSRRGFFNFESDGVGFEQPDPYRENDFAGEVVENDDGHLRRGVHHEAADADFNIRLRRLLCVGLGFEAG